MAVFGAAGDGAARLVAAPCLSSCCVVQSRLGTARRRHLQVPGRQFSGAGLAVVGPTRPGAVVATSVCQVLRLDAAGAGAAGAVVVVAAVVVVGIAAAAVVAHQRIAVGVAAVEAVVVAAAAAVTRPALVAAWAGLGEQCRGRRWRAEASRNSAAAADSRAPPRRQRQERG